MRGFCWSSPVPKAPGLFSNKQICGGERKKIFFGGGSTKNSLLKPRGWSVFTTAAFVASDHEFTAV